MNTTNNPDIIDTLMLGSDEHKLAICAEAAETIRKLRNHATNLSYMKNAYRNMLGPKGLEVVQMWDTKGIVRVHFDWTADAFKLSGEERAQIILEMESAPRREVSPGEIDRSTTPQSIEDFVKSLDNNDKTSDKADSTK